MTNGLPDRQVRGSLVTAGDTRRETIIARLRNVTALHLCADTTAHGAIVTRGRLDRLRKGAARQGIVIDPAETPETGAETGGRRERRTEIHEMTSTWKGAAPTLTVRTHAFPETRAGTWMILSAHAIATKYNAAGERTTEMAV